MSSSRLTLTQISQQWQSVADVIPVPLGAAKSARVRQQRRRVCVFAQHDRNRKHTINTSVTPLGETKQATSTR